MQEAYLRRVFVAATVCVLGGAIASGMACSSSPRKIPGTTGGAGSSPTGNNTGAAGSQSGPAGAGNTTGAAGDQTGTAGSTGAGGMATGAAGDNSGTGGTGGAGNTTGAAGVTTTGLGGTTGAGGDATGAAGAGGTPATDNGLKITDAFPIAVTKYWYPSGWDGDDVTKAAFMATPPPIKIEMMTGATTGPCSKRVANAIGDCFKVTYTPVGQAAGALGHASVGLIPVLPGMGSAPNYGDPTMAPHVPQGATTITAEVAGDKGGEMVTFNLWDAFQNELMTPTLTADQAWQKLTVTIPQPYDQELSPFGWYSASATPIVFYYDDIRINNN